MRCTVGPTGCFLTRYGDRSCSGTIDPYVNKHIARRVPRRAPDIAAVYILVAPRYTHQRSVARPTRRHRPRSECARSGSA